MQQNEEAKAILEQFVQAHPDDEYADDAQFLLDKLGLSPEEIIAEFDK